MSIAAYNQARDREAHAFEASSLGRAVTALLNARLAFPASEHTVNANVAQSLAGELAFGRSWPAFYAGRSLRLW